MKKFKVKKIELASQEKISKVEDFVQDLLRKVFGTKGALVTDESSLLDFDFTLARDKVVHNTDKALKKIEKFYKVDVSDIKGLLLYKIAEKILTAPKRPWSVYLVRCNDSTLYCGISNDVQNRVATHNAGKGARYTKTRRPVALMYIEEVGTMGQALKREREIKSYPKKKKEALCNG
jgi:putative endonuclease